MTALLIATLLAGAELEHAAVTSARACWGESREDVATCAAQTHAMMRRAEQSGRTLVAQWWAYSNALKRAATRRPWLLEMRDADTPPRGWELAGASWSVVRPLFACLVDVARGVIEGRIPDPCGGRPMHFGSCRLDGVPDGFRRTECLRRSPQCFYERAR